MLIELTDDHDLDLGLAVAALRVEARRLRVDLLVRIHHDRPTPRVHAILPFHRQSERAALYAALRAAVGEQAHPSTGDAPGPNGSEHVPERAAPEVTGPVEGETP